MVLKPAVQILFIVTHAWNNEQHAKLFWGCCSERKVFFCVHKSVEHELPEASDLPFAKVAKAHWGAVDGSNAYADCDVAVVFGLPYRDAVTWPTNVFFALQGADSGASRPPIPG